MAHMTPWVHRYNLRELMDDSFDLFRERALSLLLAGLIPACLVVIYVVLMRVFYLHNHRLFTSLDEFNSVEDFFEHTSPRTWLYLFGLLFVDSIAVFMALTAQARIAVRQLLGQSVSYQRAFFPFLKPFFSLIVVSFIFNFLLILANIVAMIVTSIVSLVFMPLIVLAANVSEILVAIIGILLAAISVIVWMGILIYVFTLFLTVPVFLGHKHEGPFSAISHSFRIAGSNMKAHFASLYIVTHVPMVAALLLPAVAFLILLPMGLLSGQFLYTDAVVAVVTLPFLAGFTGLCSCTAALAYVDGSCRLDAMDLQMLGV